MRSGDMHVHGPLNCKALLPLGVLKLAMRGGDSESPEASDARACV
jgi:hypothetical protein